MISRQPSRRRFMQGAAATAAAGFWVWNQRAYAESKSPNEKLNIAWIGVGGKGGGDVDQAGQVGKVVAICDVDDKILANKAEKFPDAEQFADYREMIEKLGDKVDAIGVSTPDHNHFPAAMLAMKHGKHVYCQKPLTWSVWEARQLREMAQRKGLKTQMGNQGSAGNSLRKGVEFIKGGVIGDVKEIHVWTNRPIWPQAPEWTARPPESAAPKNLHWDLWLGPAPERPYAEYPGAKGRRAGAYHQFNWRGWLDFGTGALGDMACHLANMAYRGAELKYPSDVKAEACDVNNETHPSAANILWNFPGKGGKPGIKFRWYEGRMLDQLLLPDKALFPGKLFDMGKNKFPIGGALVIGDKGAMFQTDDYGGSWELLPAKKFEDVKAPEQTLKRHEGDNDQYMKQEWAMAIRGEIDQPFSNFGYAGVLTEAMLLGNVAIRNHGKRLEWNGEELRFPNDLDATQLLRRNPRSGWDVMA
jgi:predicted dehydrogenase